MTTKKLVNRSSHLTRRTPYGAPLDDCIQLNPSETKVDGRQLEEDREHEPGVACRL